MSDTTTRALSLLNLLQTHRHWPGSELAERLGVTERTVRRDVERLRDLGYRIESSPGAAGGYRLEAGSAVPPLLLTDEEAVAMAIGLRVAASQRLVSGPETTITALAKLERAVGDAIEASFGFRVPVVVRSAEAMRRTLEGNPFVAQGAAEDELHVAFLRERPSAARVAKLDPKRSPPDELVVVDDCIYLRLPNGVAKSKLTNAWLDSTLATVSTIRNWRTVAKLCELAGA